MARFLGLVFIGLLAACDGGDVGTPEPQDPGATSSPAGSEPEEQPSEEVESESPLEGSEEPTPEAQEESAVSLGFIGSELSQDAIVERLRRGGIRRIRPIRASQSLVFRVRLEGGMNSAYKPRTNQVRWGHRAEVAAYRIARALGMDNVPPAAIRHMRQAAMERQVDADFSERWEDFERLVRWGRRGSVPGAMIFWIRDLNDIELDHTRRLNEWRGWLTHDGVIPEGSERLAADLATMVAYDFLIGNWDRFSGGNIDANADGTRLYIRDHNVAFAHPMPARLLRRVSGHLERTQRLSRSWVAALRALDDEALRRAVQLDDESESEFLLSEAQMADVLDRRTAILAYVASLVDEHGEASVLYFP